MRQSVAIREVSADTSQTVPGIAEKDLQIKCREFEQLSSWEMLRLFLSATMISNLGNDGLLCNYNWQLCKSITLWVGSR